MREYQKIETVFERDPTTKKLIYGKFRNETVEYLKNNIWWITEKIDGTNIRVVWDGHKFSFYGRTDKADIPKPLLEKLNEIFNYEQEQVFEQMFSEKEVIIFGEGIGEKIQCGLYGKEYRLLVFDIMINGKYLQLDQAFEIAQELGLETVPTIYEGYTLIDAIDLVQDYATNIKLGQIEGVVARPIFTLYDNNFDRVLVKIKVRDFKELK
jgi:ATP-dependent RNA circularization protein (DNA/RNA ligase family)